MRHVLAALSVLALSACYTASPNIVHPYEAQQLSQVFDATVIGVRPITIDGTQSGIGAGAGAIAGGVAGANVGGGSGAIVGSVLGAVIGGVVGNSVERGVTQQNGVELLLQMRNGERRSVVQAADNDNWVVGEPVLVVVSAGRTRVTRAPQAYAPAPQGYPPPPPAPTYPSSGPVPPPHS
jgi:outer membrane lipoprotein SlyB